MSSSKDEMIGSVVKYCGSKRNRLNGAIGTVVATKDNCKDYEEYNLRSDECVLDFGDEDNFEVVVRIKQIQVVKRSELV